MKKMASFCTGIFLSIALAHADSSTMQPEKCPSIAAIKAVGVDKLSPLDEKTWIASHAPDVYDTPEEWSFFMLTDGKNQAAALRKANRQIANMHLERGPDVGDNDWECVYLGKNKILGLAVTPPQIISARIKALLY